MKWPRQRILREIKKAFPYDTVPGCPWTLPLFDTDTVNKGEKSETQPFIDLWFFYGSTSQSHILFLDCNLTVRFIKSSDQKQQWFQPWLVSDKGKLGLQNVQVQI